MKFESYDLWSFFSINEVTYSLNRIFAVAAGNYIENPNDLDLDDVGAVLVYQYRNHTVSGSRYRAGSAPPPQLRIEVPEPTTQPVAVVRRTPPTRNSWGRAQMQTGVDRKYLDTPDSEASDDYHNDPEWGAPKEE